MPKKTTELPYPNLRVVACVSDPSRVAEGMETEPPITAEKMKELLGWEVIPPGAGKDAKPLLTDAEGNEVRCKNITKNRPLDIEWAYTLAQEHLNKRFAPDGPNGETMVIARSGEVLSAQHRGLGLILAEQMRTGAQSDHWKKLWKGPVTMETLIAYGVSESSETIRTLDNVRPRTFADVLFSEGSAFKGKKLKDVEREQLCLATNVAIKLLWDRVGMKANAFTSYLTHSEALDFLRRHPRIADAVYHVWVENKYDKEAYKAAQAAAKEKAKRLGQDPPKGETRGKIEKYLSLGTAGAFMYLMAFSASDRQKWLDAKSPSEKALDDSNWDKAEEFWTLLASDASEMTQVRLAKRSGTDNYIFVKGETGGSVSERRAVIIKAFNNFAKDKSITAKTVELKYVPNAEGENILDESPVLGGLDIGKSEKPKRKAPEGVNIEEGEKLLSGDDPETVEEAKERIKREGLEATRDDHPSKNGKGGKGGKKKDTPPALIHEPEGEDDSFDFPDDGSEEGAETGEPVGAERD